MSAHSDWIKKAMKDENKDGAFRFSHIFLPESTDIEKAKIKRLSKIFVQVIILQKHWRSWRRQQMRRTETL